MFFDCHFKMYFYSVNSYMLYTSKNIFPDLRMEETIALETALIINFAKTSPARQTLTSERNNASAAILV